MTDIPIDEPDYDELLLETEQCLNQLAEFGDLHFCHCTCGAWIVDPFSVRYHSEQRGHWVQPVAPIEQWVETAPMLGPPA